MAAGYSWGQRGGAHLGGSLTLLQEDLREEITGNAILFDTDVRSPLGQDRLEVDLVLGYEGSGTATMDIDIEAAGSTVGGVSLSLEQPDVAPDLLAEGYVGGLYMRTVSVKLTGTGADTRVRVFLAPDNLPGPVFLYSVTVRAEFQP